MNTTISPDAITFAFQPIVDVDAGGRPFAYEALLRGRNGETAEAMLASVHRDEAIAFDAACRKRALEMAAFIGLRTRLSLNISAGAICDYRYGLHATLRAARQVDWPADRLIFEMTEHEPVTRPGKLVRWIAAARNRGAMVALDDFGAGYATINGLLQLRPHMIKLDMQLVRGIDTDGSRQSIVRGILEACDQLGCGVIAEGVETQGELAALHNLGVKLMQGYLFARPALECLPSPARLAAVTPSHPLRPATPVHQQAQGHRL